MVAVVVVVMLPLLLKQEKKQCVLMRMIQKTGGRKPIFIIERRQKQYKYLSSNNNRDSSYTVFLTGFLFLIAVIKICRRFDYPMELSVNALDGFDCLCCYGRMSFIILYFLVEHCPEDPIPILKHLCPYSCFSVSLK